MLSIQYAAMENTVFATTSYEKKNCETQFMSPNMTERGVCDKLENCTLSLGLWQLG